MIGSFERPMIMIIRSIKYCGLNVKYLPEDRVFNHNDANLGYYIGIFIRCGLVGKK